MIVDCDIRKWGDKPHYRFDAELLGRDEHGTWLAGRPPVPFTGPDGPGTFSDPFAVLVPEDRWWVCSFNRHDKIDGVDIYVDVTTPAVWNSDAHVTVIDLDLDIVLRRDGHLYLDDEDEFEDHLVEYAYPEDLIRSARRTASELMDAVAARREPFGEVGQMWLDKV